MSVWTRLKLVEGAVPVEVTAGARQGNWGYLVNTLGTPRKRTGTMVTWAKVCKRLRPRV